MPRKPRKEKKTVQVVIESKPYAVVLHPPNGTHRTWYCYWAGAVYQRSTGQSDEGAAVVAAEEMLRRWVKGDAGHRAAPADARLSDDELIAIQKAHFGRHQNEDRRTRAAKSLDGTLDAIAAFSEITGLDPISAATVDDCARFQRVCLTLPKLWRKTPVDRRLEVEEYSEQARQRRAEAGRPHSLDSLERYSPNYALKLSRTLQAAFERCNRNAARRKCVRGVVDEAKLLTENPWGQFSWIEASGKDLRQFDEGELLAFLGHFETRWPGFAVPLLMGKTFLWSCGRRREIAGLKWADLRQVGGEFHFDVVCKWGVRKWFRIPDRLHCELESIRTESPFVFGAYPTHLRRFYEGQRRSRDAGNIREDFDPANVANWFHKKVTEWSKSLPGGHATTHIFRKTTLQYARRGEDINREVARDARVSEHVMMTNYAREFDPELRARSNRTFGRIAASFSPEVAARYGHVETAEAALERRLEAAVAAKDLDLAAALIARLREVRPAAG